MVFCCGYKRAAGKFSKCYGGYYREYSVNAKAARAIKTVFYALDVVNQGMQEKQSITVRCMDIEDLEKQAEAIRVEQIKLYELYLTEEKFVPLSTTDEYFQVPDYGETYPFSVRGQTILLDSCSLAAALARLPEQTQEEIFLYYFQHLTQKEIGEQSGWTRSTIGRHIRLALKRLKEEMEVLSHE